MAKMKRKEPEFDAFEFGVDTTPPWFEKVPVKHPELSRTKAYFTTSMWVIPKRGNWFVLLPDGQVEFYDTGVHLAEKYEVKV